GQTVALAVGDTQLRSGVRALFAHDQPHPLGPAGQVDHVGDLADPGPLAGLAVGVVGRRPRRGRDAVDGGVELVGDGHPDRVGQPSAPLGDPVKEGVGASGGVGADQGLAASAVGAGELLECCCCDGDVVEGGVGSGVAGPEQGGGGFSGSLFAVVDEVAKRREGVGVLPGGGRHLLVGVGGEGGGVQVQGHPALFPGGWGIAGQVPLGLACGGAGGADRGDGLVWLGGQGGDGAGDGGVGGHGPVQVGLVAQQGGIGQAVAAQGQGDGQVGADLAGVV